MRTLDSPPVDVAVDSSERRDSTPSSTSNNGSNLQSGLGETKHLMERLNTAQVKVKKLQRLEAALVDFFMEVMDRSDNNDRATRSLETESTFARGKRKEQFLKKAEGDPISLLNALRTHLRLKFAEQEAHEAAAERRSLAESLNNQQKEQDIRDKFQQLERTCTQFKEQQQSLLRQLNRHEVDQTRTRRQHQTLLEKMNVQLQEVRSREQEAQQLVAKQQQEIAALKEARDALIKVTQTQKPLEGVRATADSGSNSAATPSATTAAASASGASPSHTNGDFFGTPAENQTLRRALRKYELKMAQTEADNEERKREVQRLQQQLTGLRQSTQLQMYSQLEKESRHLRELAADLKKRLAESEADLLRTKGTLKERESHMQKMRDEYARLFNAVQKQKQPTHYSPSKLGRSAIQFVRSMDGNFDGIDGPKHERVAKALEQVNGFRYRYHPAPQDGKKILRFDSDGEEDLSGSEDEEDDCSGDETQRHERRRTSKGRTKHTNDDSIAPIMTLDDHIENLLRKTRTLAMLKIANNTAGTIPSDSEDDSDEADDVVSEELSIGSLSSVGSPKFGASSGKLSSLGSLSLGGTPKHGASSSKLSSLGSSSSMGGCKSSLLGTAAMRLARTISAFLCLPRAISYVDLEAITEKLLESPSDQFDDEEYADLIDYHVDSAREDEAHTETDEDEPIWKRRNSRPVRPLNLAEDPTDLELHQRQIFVEANRFGGVSTRNFFLASSKHLLSTEDSKGSMYFGVSPSGRVLGSTTNGSSKSLIFGRQGSGSTVTSNSSCDEAAAENAGNLFNEEEYTKWRTQVKEDYLAWLNAKVEARKRRKMRVKKGDPNKKPRWLLLYEASKNPTQKYRPDEKE
ncbi:hypothetical protein PF001_g5542 [Phytophthora fragariae]|uniref:Uncharacterized protein n=1 Tax=Phytophthora fragariae TaxID=53985 RepID=A0A6A4EBS6_9STRA|nr:hypothetical protein PF009_g6963 [Phytophthora fragariae]KAE9320154.1 hypothetical protein PF001_g5542 [Phytophthora fragariae]